VVLGTRTGVTEEQTAGRPAALGADDAPADAVTVRATWGRHGLDQLVRRRGDTRQH
jgi:hypothetical protein